MLTRLKIQGFKNLVDVDLHFGPFTCIAGPNGCGKSNLFDVIEFLSLLADRPLLEAARAVRGGGRVANLFHRTGENRWTEMTISAEMIVPSAGKDDLGQPALASSTFLVYEIQLRHAINALGDTIERLEIAKESLTYITKGDAHRHLLFPHTARQWRDSVVMNKKRGEGFISTDVDESGATVIRLHQDGGGSRGRPLSYLASALPRTVLSSTNAAESPTALLARREMQSWRLLQLEPSALRRPDSFTDPLHIGSDGSHLAATLFRLEHAKKQLDHGPDETHTGLAAGHVYAEIANRLSSFLEDVREVRVDKDEKRELLTLQVKTSARTEFPAPALSDGSLRFLALAILEIDPDVTGVICLEEPENGVHPKRIPAMLQLLQRIAVDPQESVGEGNSLRQVIVNTHAPSVVQQVSEDTLLLARSTEHVINGQRLLGLSLRPLDGTWRDHADQPTASLGELLGYLNPAPATDEVKEAIASPRRQRVVDRSDVQALLPFMKEK